MMRTTKRVLLTSFFLVGLSFAGASVLYAQDASKDDVLKVLSSRKDVSKFVGLIKDAGLKDYFLSKDDVLTVFAPSDEALSNASGDVIKRAKADKEHLISFVKYHTINGSQVFEGNIRGRRAGPSTGNGEGVAFEGLGKEPKVNDAGFVAADIRASNGVIHVMNKILIPPSIAQSEEEKLKARQKEEAEMKKLDDERMKIQEEQMKKREAEEAKKKPVEAPADTKAPSDAKAPAGASSGEVKPAPSNTETKKSGGFLKMLGF